MQQVMLIYAPWVLGWEQRQRIAETYALGLARDALAAVMDAGLVEHQPVEPLAHVLLAALHEAALFVARAPDHAKARAEVGGTIERLIARL